MQAMSFLFLNVNQRQNFLRFDAPYADAKKAVGKSLSHTSAG
jgi:hypothetical protein